MSHQRNHVKGWPVPTKGLWPRFWKIYYPPAGRSRSGPDSCPETWEFAICRSLPATYRNITILHKQVQATHRVFDLGFEVAYLCKGALPLPSLTSKPEPKLFFTPGPSSEHHRLAMAIAFRRSPNVFGRFSFHWQLNSVAAKKKPALTHVRR